MRSTLDAERRPRKQREPHSRNASHPTHPMPCLTTTPATPPLLPIMPTDASVAPHASHPGAREARVTERWGQAAGESQPAVGSERTAVTAIVAYPMVKLPPRASRAVPTPRNSLSSTGGGSRVKLPRVGIWSSQASRV
jgi:hypothetical protein